MRTPDDDPMADPSKRDEYIASIHSIVQAHIKDDRDQWNRRQREEARKQQEQRERPVMIGIDGFNGSVVTSG